MGVTSSCRGLLQRLLREEDGALTVLALVVLTAALGAGALAVDVAQGYSVRTMLQNAADEAAFAAVGALPSGDAALERATFFVGQTLLGQDYGEVLTADDVETGRWDAAAGTFTPTEAGAADAVRVSLHSDVRTAMAWIFGEQVVTVRASAIAALVAGGGGEACILALQPSGVGISIRGSVVINQPACSLAANSTADDAFEIRGSALISVETIHLAGDMDARGSVSLNTARPMETHADPRPDPYAYLPGTFEGLVNRSCPGICSGTLQPGRYLSNVALRDNVTLQPGLYYFAGGISVNGSLNLSGNGVTLAFGGDFTINGSATLYLTAPKTAPATMAGGFAGVLLYGVDSGSDFIVRGSSAGTLNGAIYLPEGTLDIHGSSGFQGCSQVVVSWIELRGSASAREHCEDVPMAPIPLGRGKAAIVG